MVELPTSDYPYRIYNYVPDTGQAIDPHVAPWTVNYKTGLTITLAKQRTIVLGEVIEVFHYAEYDLENDRYSVPLVRETFSYDRDTATGWANYRTQQAEFYLDDELIGPHPKVFTPKVYRTVGEKRNEIERKKKNQTGRAAEVAVGALMQALQMNLADASNAGKAYWSSLVTEISQYEQGNPFPLRDRLNGDTDPGWVPTVKDFILAELV